MRVENWENILAAELEKALETKFVWGETDCALWSTKIAYKLTGIDKARRFRNRYTTKIGAYRCLRSEGYADLNEALDDLYPIKSVKRAQRGDLVYFSDAVGVCDGEYSYFLGEKRLQRVETLSCVKAWGVG